MRSALLVRSTPLIRAAQLTLLAASAAVGVCASVATGVATAQDVAAGTMCARDATATAVPAWLVEAWMLDEAAVLDAQVADAVAALHRDRLGLREAFGAEDVLWCASPDDPRCAPARHGAGGIVQLWLGGVVFVLPPRPATTVPPAAGTSVRPGNEVAGAADGVRRGILRPPRA
jgi:hypothetical protein